MAMANMSIEGGARAGMFCPDETTFKYLKGKPMAPKGAEWDAAVEFWKVSANIFLRQLDIQLISWFVFQGLRSDEGAHYDRVVKINAVDIPPTVTWGTSPEDTIDITGTVPRPEEAKNEEEKGKIERALTYMGLEGGMKVQDIKITNVSGNRRFRSVLARKAELSLSSRSSSVPAPTLALRIFELLPASSRVARLLREFTRWSFLVLVSSRSKQRRRDSTESFPRLDSTGERQDARCVSV